jgi:hypothetical protein
MVNTLQSYEILILDLETNCICQSLMGIITHAFLLTVHLLTLDMKMTVTTHICYVHATIVVGPTPF